MGAVSGSGFPPLVDLRAFHEVYVSALASFKLHRADGPGASGLGDYVAVEGKLVAYWCFSGNEGAPEGIPKA